MTGRMGRLAFVLLLLPALLDPGVFARLDALRTAADPLGIAPKLTLHLWAPVVSASVTLVCWLPGLPLALAWVRTGYWQTVVGVSVAIDLLLLGVVVPLVDAMGFSLHGRAFLGFCLALAALSAWIFRRRITSGAIDRPSQGSVITLLALLLLPMALFPDKFLWESLNGDGAHALESARLLVHGPVPFWDAAAGHFARFPGITSFVFAYPSSWAMRAIGELDVAARLPFAGFLALLVIAAADLARAGQARRDVPALLLLTAPLAYGLAMMFSATYNPYSADIALPATQDTLLMVAVLGAFAAWIRKDVGISVLLGAMAFFSLPNGLMLLGLLLPAAILIERPVPWRRAMQLAATLVLFLGLAALAPLMLQAAQLPVPGREYGALGLLRYFAFVQFTDWHRVVWVAVMAGILPLITPLRWSALDAGTRVVLIVAGLYFLMFFCMAFVSLHYFVPVATLLVAAHWRALAAANYPARRQALTVASSLVAVALAWPSHLRVQRDGEDIGRRITILVPGYDEMLPSAFAAVPLLKELFPQDWSPLAPAVYAGSELTWNRYASRSPASLATAQYALLGADAAVPEGMEQVAGGVSGRLFVRSRSEWDRDRTRQPVTSPGSALLEVPRGVLFRAVPRGESSKVWDVLEILDGLGLAPAALKRLRTTGNPLPEGQP